MTGIQVVERASRLSRLAGQLHLGLGALVFVELMDFAVRSTAARRAP